MEEIGCHVWRRNDSCSSPQKAIWDLMEKYTEFFTSQKFKWEEMKKELGELKKLQVKCQILQQDKNQMYLLAQELLSCRIPSLIPGLPS